MTESDDAGYELRLVLNLPENEPIDGMRYTLYGVQVLIEGAARMEVDPDGVWEPIGQAPINLTTVQVRSLRYGSPLELVLLIFLVAGVPLSPFAAKQIVAAISAARSELYAWRRDKTATETFEIAQEIVRAHMRTANTEELNAAARALTQLEDMTTGELPPLGTGVADDIAKPRASQDDE